MIKSRRTTLAWTCGFRRAALGGALGLTMVAGLAPGAAHAQDSENRNSFWNFDKRVYDTVMHGLGLTNGSEDVIDYKERSPLVVPANRALPPPQANAAPAPNWPDDPDLRRRVAAKAKASRQRELGRDDWDDLSTVNPTVNTRTRGPAPSKTGGPAGDGDGASMESSMLPSALGYKGGLFSKILGGVAGNGDEVGTFTGEPPRTSLIEPPPGYQVPSPSQPYGVTKKNDYGKARRTEDIPVGNDGL